MKRLTVIGRGTVGCMAVAHFLRWTDWEINWVYDPSLIPAAVGEGTTLTLPRSLDSNLRFNSADLERIGATVKTGIFKKNWNTEDSFLHSFPAGAVGMHFNAVAFQNYVFEKISKSSRVTLVEDNLNPDDIDSDFVMVCTGSPRDFTNYEKINHIPVNACFVTQSPWEYARFTHTLTIARPYGWIFGIPLKNRCSIGYLYNENISSLEDVKEDIKVILTEYNLVPNFQNHIRFNNYHRKNNFSNRVVYNGNASFFLEPLEATSTSFADNIIRYSFEIWQNNMPVEVAENQYLETISGTESMISMHYSAGSIFENDFWKYAKNLGENKMKKDFESNSEFSKIIKYAVSENCIPDQYHRDVGSWSARSYSENISGLGLKEKFIQLINNY
jgi:hypothetical protein